MDIVLPGDRHASTSTFVISTGQPRKVLLLLHKKLGVWLPPGGHVERHENPYQGAIREVAEETGLDISSVFPGPQDIDGKAWFLPQPWYILEELIPAHGEQPEHFHIDSVYKVELPEGSIAHDPNESNGIAWFTAEELADLPLFENVRQLLIELGFKPSAWN